MIAGTPAERRGWLIRAAHGPDPSSRSLEKESDGNGDDGRVPHPEVDDDLDDGSIGDGSALGSEIDAGALADHDSDGFESDQDGSLRGEDGDLEINGFAEDFGHTEHGVSADADMAQAGACGWRRGRGLGPGPFRRPGSGARVPALGVRFGDAGR